MEELLSLFFLITSFIALRILFLQSVYLSPLMLYHVLYDGEYRNNDTLLYGHRSFI
jgi:hypothetical protein